MVLSPGWLPLFFTLGVTVWGRSEFSGHSCAHTPRSAQSQPPNSCQSRCVAVSEREDHHEALSISNEAELSNNLPGDDLDECLLYGGELCQHLCINTVGSYKCSCFPEFTLQEDGTSCSPGEKRFSKLKLFFTFSAVSLRYFYGCWYMFCRNCKM